MPRLHTCLLCSTTTIRKISYVFLLMLGMLSGPANIFAQTFTTSVSETFRAQGGSFHKVGSDFISLSRVNDKAQFGYTFKLHKVKFGLTLRRYDSTMQLIKEQPLFGGEKKTGPFPPYFGMINNKLYLLYFLYEKEEEDVKLLIAEIDAVSLEVKAEKELLTVNQKNTGLIKSWEAFANLNIQVAASPDNSHLLLWWASQLNNEFSLCVLDRNFTPLWKKYETIKGTEALYQFSGCIDNNERVYISYRFNKGDNDWNNEVLVYEKESKLKEYQIKPQEGGLHQMQVVASKKDNLVHLVGSYSAKSGKLNGIFHQTINTTDISLNSAVSIPFQTTLVDQLDKDGWASTKEKSYGIDPLAMSCYALPDGRLALIGEFRRVTRTERAQYDISGSLLQVMVDGKNIVAASIPKYRVSAGSTIGDSYYAFPYQNTLLIFYNDNEENLNRDIMKPPTASSVYKRSSLAAAFMNADGTVKRQKLIDLTKEGFLAIGESIQPLAWNQLMVPVYKIKGLGGTGEDRKWGTIGIK